MAETIDPRFLSVINWTGLTSAVLAPHGVPPILLDPDRWRDWAIFVVAIPEVASLNPPRPEYFSDWSAWAHQFNEVARLLTT